MADKFGLDFTVLDAAALRELRRTHGLEANPFAVYPRMIISLQWLRTPRVQRLLDEVLTPQTRYPGYFDLLVVDEAHHCAPPAPAGARGVSRCDSKQTRAVRRLGEHTQHRLFLSATPHNGYPESWQALLAMLDPQRFTRGVEPDEAAVAQVMVRRLKDEIRDRDGNPRFPGRRNRAIDVRLHRRRAGRPPPGPAFHRLAPAAARHRRGLRASDLVDAAAEEAAVLRPGRIRGDAGTATWRQPSSGTPGIAAGRDAPAATPTTASCRLAGRGAGLGRRAGRRRGGSDAERALFDRIAGSGARDLAIGSGNAGPAQRLGAPARRAGRQQGPRADRRADRDLPAGRGLERRAGRRLHRVPRPPRTGWPAC